MAVILRLVRVSDDGKSEVERPGVRLPVEGGQLGSGGVEADLETLDLTEPPVLLGLGDALLEILGDLFETVALSWGNAKYRAANAGMFMIARRPVGPAAGAELEFAELEVVLEFLPFGVGRFAVLSCRAQCASSGEVRPAG